MSYVAKSLGPGEEIIYQATIHWIVYLRPVLFIVLGVAVGVIFWPAFALALIGLLWFGVSWIIVHGSELAVTNRKVVAKWGIVARDTVEQRLEKVDSIAVDQSFWGRVFNYGSVTVHGTGLTNTRAIRMIADPILFRRKVEQAIDARIAPAQPMNGTAPVVAPAEPNKDAV